jgi:hypothetical protein
MHLGKCSERRAGQGASETVIYCSRRSDPLGRFVPTPHAITLQLMGRTVRLEANSPKIIDLALQFFAWYPRMPQGDPELTWRIVTESNGHARPGMSTSGFSDADLSFVNLGQRSFLAVDAETRLGVAFLDEIFADADEPRFIGRPPLPTLFCMSAASLGITCISAASVAFGGKCVLLLGEPNSGKSTTSYVAAKLGMEFFADQVVFLECASSVIYAWGDPFPAVFRPATLDFFPELGAELRPSSYGDHRFYYFDKSKLQSKPARSVAPLCSILLERAVAEESRLDPLPPAELSRHLGAGLLFKESERFRSQESRVFAGLAKLPAYRLSYGENPAAAATIVRDLLINHSGDGEK